MALEVVIIFLFIKQFCFYDSVEIRKGVLVAYTLFSLVMTAIAIDFIVGIVKELKVTDKKEMWYLVCLTLYLIKLFTFIKCLLDFYKIAIIPPSIYR